MKIKKKQLFLFSNFLLIVFIGFFPLIILLSPIYWQNTVQAPLYYLGSIFFFCFPMVILLSQPVLRNPFFILPFTCSFIIASLSQTYGNFAKNYLLYIGFIATLFGVLRTRPPFVLLELELYLTSYFIDFFEVRRFWRIIILIICPLFIPILWALSIFIPW